jgi:hypothetical protein
MSFAALSAIFTDFNARLHSADVRSSARHPEFSTAFTRQRKLPLPSLLAVMFTDMRMSVQAELDEFFAHLRQQAQLVRHVSEQAFAQVRAKLSLTVIPQLNDWLVERADHHGFVPRWHGLRLVAADASTVRFGLRASHVERAALADQILFGLFLPGAELMLTASLHGITECGERQMLFQTLDLLSSTDLLLLDRGYPSSWLVAVLNQRQLPFCMRVDNSGYTCVRDFLRFGLAEQVVTLRAPNQADERDYECPRAQQTVHLVRHVAPNGNVRLWNHPSKIKKVSGEIGAAERARATCSACHASPHTSERYHISRQREHHLCRANQEVFSRFCASNQHFGRDCMPEEAHRARRQAVGARLEYDHQVASLGRRQRHLVG